MKVFRIVVLMAFLSILSLTVFAQDVAITIDPATGTYAQDDVFTVTFNMDSGSNAVQTFQIAMIVPAALEVWNSGSSAPGLGGIAVNTTVWNGPAPPGLPKQDGNIVTFGGAVSGSTGVTGVAEFADVTFHVKSDATEGDHDLTMQAHQGDYLNGTLIISTGFAELTTSLGQATYTVGAGGPWKRWDFPTDSEGWSFSGQISTFTELTSASDAGSLDLSTTDNTNSFGFWHSPGNAMDTLDGTMLHRARFKVMSDQTEMTTVPSFRLRWNSYDNYMQSDDLLLNSKDGGETMPDATGKDYDIFFQPQHSALDSGITGLLAFDVINFDDKDVAAAKLSADYVQVDRMLLTDLPAATAVATYTFDTDEEAWTNSELIDVGSFTAPTFAYDGTETALLMTSTDTNTFGFWMSPDGITLASDVLYILTVNAGSESTSPDAPIMRVRIYDSNNQAVASYQAPAFTEYLTIPDSDPGVSQFTYNDHKMFFVNPGATGTDLKIAIDMINLDDAAPAETSLAINSVTLESVAIPTF